MLQPLKIVDRDIGELSPNPSNARTHTSEQVRQIATSIKRFGFNNPILVDRTGLIIAGHGRVEAAKLLGMQTVPTVRLDHLSEAQKRAYVIADNRLAEMAGWDREILAIELQHLMTEDLDFEITDVGFETAEIDLLLSNAAEQPDPADNVDALEEGPPVSQQGDLWLIGPHRLHCADALRTDSYDALMGGERAEMIFTDPPYNVPIPHHVSGLGRVRHENFAMASGEMTEAEFTRFLTTAFRHMVSWSKDGAIHFVCMDWRHLLEFLRAGRIAFAELKNLCVWAKSNGGMGSLYRSQHELIAVFKSGKAAHINNVELGQHGRNRTNVWSYAGMNSFQTGRDEALAMHPTVKPVAMVADAMLDCSERRGLILDPFAGSGTSIIAAERVGRRAYCIELDPSYVDVSLRRAQLHCGIEPVHAATGRSFSEMQAEKRSYAQSVLDPEVPVRVEN